MFIKISKIIGCELKKIEDLGFDFVEGACNTYRSIGILFCFGPAIGCHAMKVSQNGLITVQNISDSNYWHFSPVSLASYKGSPFVTSGSHTPGTLGGGNISGVSNNKTELFDIVTMNWKTMADCPYW